MGDIVRSIDDEDVEWVMQWSKNGSPDRADETVFEDGPALALLLANQVVFLNCHWWEKEWPEDAQKAVAVFVNCNDVFAWASADGEDLPYREIEPLYKMWRKDPAWGAAVWCIQRRKQMPQKPVEKAIREGGIWDLDAMSLDANWQDAETQAIFRSISRAPAEASPGTVARR